MPSPRQLESFPRALDDIDNESTSFSSVYQEFGMRPASLRPSTSQTIQTVRLSNLSSISEWSRQTIGCIQSSDFSWFRLEDASSRHSYSMRGGGDKYIDLEAHKRNRESDSTNSQKLTALPRQAGRFKESEEVDVSIQVDAANPRDWKPWKKWLHVVVLTKLSFVA